MATINFDYNSILSRIEQNLRAKNEWKSFLSYGVVENLIAPIAQELAYCMQYQEYLTYENWWSKARNKSSLLVQSPVHGYSVPRKQGAIGTLRVSTSKEFNSPYSEDSNISLPKFFQFSGNSVYVACAHDYSLSSGMDYIDIECKQGETKTITWSAEGRIYEEKLIEDSNIDNDFFELYVNGMLWEKVDTLFEYNENDQVYELYTKPDLSGVIIKFGNNIFGKKLNLNDVVEFKYLATDGFLGNIYSSNIINVVETQSFDNEGRPVKLYVTNTSSIIGGKDYPTIDEIRTLSPRVYQTGDRASSLDDYETKVKQFTYISKVNIWGAYEHLKDNNLDPWDFIPSEENVVHVALLDLAYENLTYEEKQKVVEDLHKKNDPTDIIQFEEVEKIPLIFDIKGTVQNSSFTLAQVRANIEETLRKTYGIEYINFGVNIYDSDFTRLVDEVNGVRNHNSSIYMKKEGKFFTEGDEESSYVGSFSLPIYPVDYSSTILYIKDLTEENPKYKEFAYIDVNGNIIGYTCNTNGSRLNLTTGKGALVVNSGLEGDYTNYEIKIVYKSAIEDLILTSRNQIFECDEIKVSLEYPTI